MEEQFKKNLIIFTCILKKYDIGWYKVLQKYVNKFDEVPTKDIAKSIIELYGNGGMGTLNDVGINKSKVSENISYEMAVDEVANSSKLLIGSAKKLAQD